MRWLLLTMSLLLGACGPASPPSDSEGGDSTVVLRVAGELKSANSRFFGPPGLMNAWHYTIAFMVPDGALVEAGQPILRFDAEELERKLRSKESSLNEKQKKLSRQEIVAREELEDLRLVVEEARAERDKAAIKASIPESLLAGREYREYQLTLELAEINLDLRQAELEQEETVLATERKILEREISVLRADIERLTEYIDSMTLLAPGDGVVIHVADRRNSKPAVGDTVSRGRHVLEFPDLSRLEVHLEIPEREYARVTIGQEVRFVLDAAPEQRLRGLITELASVIRTQSSNQPRRVFDAKVAVQNPDPALMRPGMRIAAEIQTGGGS